MQDETNKKYTLDEALEVIKQELREKVIGKGGRCPVCDQFAKVYKRKIYARAVVGLIRIYNLTEDDESYYHITKINPTNVSGGGDFAKLVHWGLAEEMPKDPEDKKKKTSGFWRITPLGRDFVELKATVPAYIMTYNSQCLKVFGEPSTIKDALGEHFDYEKLMSE